MIGCRLSVHRANNKIGVASKGHRMSRQFRTQLSIAYCYLFTLDKLSYLDQMPLLVHFVFVVAGLDLNANETDMHLSRRE